MEPAFPLDTSIAIIGGGPSGLAAAWFLVKLGYKNITVLEKEQQVGGKCLTVNHTSSAGERKNYELGAEYITFSYDILYSFLEELDEPIVEAGPIMAMAGSGKFEPPLKIDNPETILALLRYFHLAFTYRAEIESPTNENFAGHPVLSLSSKTLIEKYGLEPIEGILLVQQFGYGTFENFPALHLFRTVSYDLLLRIVAEELHIPICNRPVAALAVNGTQGLFKHMANWIDSQKKTVYPDSPAVLTGSNVTKVVPTENKVEVHTSSTKITVDKVICSVPPDLLAGMMDLSQEWNSLFTKIMYHPYWVGCLEFCDRKLPQYYYQNEEPKAFEPVQFSKRYEEGQIIAYGYNYNYARDAAKEDRPEIDSVLAAFLKDNLLIDRYDTLDLEKYWDSYHPHVSLEEFQSGYFDKLARFQGTNGIYLTGDTLCMESMECSCRHAKYIVENFFGTKTT